jgi:hypothetical protein
VRKHDLADTAHHEAAHAVAAFYLRVKIKHVTIEPNADSLGHLRTSVMRLGSGGLFDDSLRGVDRAERLIVVFYAGPLASRKFSPRSHWRAGGEVDFDTASLLFTHISSSDEKCRSLYWRLLWRRAEVLVETHWKEVRHLALALLKHKTLDSERVGDEIRRSRGVKLISIEP